MCEFSSTNRLQRPRVVIVGGGFAGVQTAKSLKKVPVQITLIDRNNFHLFQPLLYQVATGELSPADIATPLRYIFKRQRNISVMMDEVIDVNVNGREVITRNARVPFDYLIVATGSQSSYFGKQNWAKYSFTLKSIPEALEIRKRIYGAFERMECVSRSTSSGRSIRFVVVGGGATGVELSAAIGDLSRITLRNEFKHIDPESTEILLIEAGNRILPHLHVELSNRAREDLKRFGVQVLTRTTLTGIDSTGIDVRNDVGSRHIEADAVFWAAGVCGSSMGSILREKTPSELDKAGRIMVDPDLTLPGHSNIFIVGDLACAVDQATGVSLPSVAPVAQQQGRYVGKHVKDTLQGKRIRPFRYRNRGMLAVIGRSAAVADFGRIRLQGFAAWLVWVFVHIIEIVEFENRLLVFVQWV